MDVHHERHFEFNRLIEMTLIDKQRRQFILFQLRDETSIQ